MLSGVLPVNNSGAYDRLTAMLLTHYSDTPWDLPHVRGDECLALSARRFPVEFRPRTAASARQRILRTLRLPWAVTNAIRSSRADDKAAFPS